MSRDKTHWAGCWEEHHACAIAEIKRLQSATGRSAIIEECVKVCRAQAKRQREAATTFHDDAVVAENLRARSFGAMECYEAISALDRTAKNGA
jgi:hypothetical protein